MGLLLLSSPQDVALSLNGAVAPIGSPAQAIAKFGSGTLPSTGSATRVRAVLAILASALLPTSSLSRVSQKLATASLISEGQTSSFKLFARLFDGVLASGGTLGKDSIMFRSSILPNAGDLQPASEKILAAELQPLGSARKIIENTTTGSIVFAGVVNAIQLFALAVAGSIGTMGSLVLSNLKYAAGVISPLGLIRKLTAKTANGALLPSGTSGQTYEVSIGGTLAPLGIALRTGLKQLLGFLTPVGTVRRDIAFLKAGVLVGIGTLRNATLKILSGVIGIVGTLSTSVGGVVLTPVLRLSASYKRRITVSASYVRRITGLSASYYDERD